MSEDRSENRTLKPPMIALVAKSVPPLTREAGRSPERIIQTIDQARFHKIAFVSGAEGYGKTTALTEWYRRLCSEGSNVVWFTCDRADTDIKRFWMNFHYAICSGFEDVGVPAYETLTAMALPEAIYTLANSLCIAASKQGGLFIILERFDVLKGSESLDSLIMFIEALSDDVHLVLSSRRVYSKYDFASSLSSEMPLSVSTTDLAFTREELASALQQSTNRPLDDALIKAAYEKTRGWQFAVNLLAERLSASDDPKAVIGEFSGTDPQMRSFFEHEVFAPLPPHLQKFLIKTSFLGFLSKQLCGYVLDQPNVEEVLDELVFRNTFITSMSTGLPRFVLHPLFAEWLIAGKMHQLPEVELRLLNSRAARWSLRHNMPITAAKHQILASEQDDLFSLILVAYPQMTRQDIMKLTFFYKPPDTTQIGPCFMLLAAWAYAYAADLDNMRLWAEKAREAISANANEEFLYSLEVLEVKGLCLECRFEAGIRRIEIIRQKLKSPRFLPLNIILTNCYAEALDHQGLLEQGMERHQAFESLTSSGSFAFLRAINQYEMAYSFFCRGLLDKAERICRTIEATTIGDHPVCGAAIALETIIDILHGHDVADEARLEKARTLVSRHRNADMYLDWNAARTWAFVCKGDIESANKTLLEAANLVKISPNAIPRGTSVLPFQYRALLLLLRGDAKSAAEVYVEFDRLDIPGTDYSKLMRSYVELMASDVDDPQTKLEEIIGQAQKRGYRLLVLNFTIDLAIYRYTHGQPTRAIRLLHDVLEYAAHSNVVSPFTWRATSIRPLLISYIATMKSDYARRAFVQRVLKQPEFENARNSEETVSLAQLTNREREILKLATEGLSRAEIAAELCVEESTVKSHLSHMYAKLGVSRFKDLLFVASELGI